MTACECTPPHIHPQASQPLLCFQSLVSPLAVSRIAAECWSTHQAVTCWLLSCLREASGAVKILSTILSYCSTSTSAGIPAHASFITVSLSAIHVTPLLGSPHLQLQVHLQLLDGVQFLHDSNFVHRDLKLENLMIDACGCLKIGQNNDDAARAVTCSCDAVTITNVFTSFCNNRRLRSQFALRWPHARGHRHARVHGARGRAGSRL